MSQGCVPRTLTIFRSSGQLTGTILTFFQICFSFLWLLKFRYILGKQYQTTIRCNGAPETFQSFAARKARPELIVVGDLRFCVSGCTLGHWSVGILLVIRPLLLADCLSLQTKVLLTFPET